MSFTERRDAVAATIVELFAELPVGASVPTATVTAPAFETL